MPALLPQLNDLIELRHQARTVGIASHHPVNSILCGLYASVFRGQGMDFEEVREYREGDEIRNMDWRVTARTGVPHLKIFREERERTVILSVDVNPKMAFGTRGTFKSIQAARAAALLGWSANSNQDRVGALLYGDPALGIRNFRPTRARRSLWRMLRAFTEPINSGCLNNDPLIESLEDLNRTTPTGALIFLIGDFNRDPIELERPIGRLRQRREVIIIPIDDPVDWNIPAMGKILFSSHNGQRIEIDTDSSEGRESYHKRWKNKRKQLLTIAARLGIKVIPINTTAEVRGTLVKGFQQFLKHKF